MKLLLKRQPSSAKSTIGELYVDGVFECHTLEDVVRDVKIHGETAIPAGTYKVIINMSNRFKRLLPLLLNVPDFEGVRIHSGNSDADTSGCVLVGTYDPKTPDWVSGSRIAFDKLFAKMQAAKDITLEIV